MAWPTGVGALVMILACGCGGDDAPGMRDGGDTDSGPGGADGGGVRDAGPTPCTTGAECDDGLFCNGVESCDTATGRCGAGVPPDCDDAIACTTDACSEEMARCTVRAPDADGDGHGDVSCLDATGAPVGDDCNDADARAFPGNSEVCDGHDDDCNPDTFGFLDADGDGSGSAACCNGSSCGGDCDDANVGIHPGALDGPPMACDTVDNDCDGARDEGCPCTEGVDRECGSDAARMRIGICRPGSQFCIGGMWAECSGETLPAEEICDGEDDDCDGMRDEDVTRRYYRDADGDGFGTMAESTMACSAPAGYSSLPSDCDDANPSINPGATEVCNGIDDTCNTITDEGVQSTFYQDMDGDGFGNSAVTRSACTPPPGYVFNSTDCNDAMAAISPVAPERCDGIDNDCNGTTDPGCACSDGMTRPCGTAMSMVGECRIGVQRCISGAWAECVGAVEPRPETCNGLDDDCDSMTDDGVTSTFRRDSDGDAYGSTTAPTMTGCVAPAGYVAAGGDCNDVDAAIHPGATELCDGVDQNCAMGTMDEPRRAFYRDADADFWGAMSMRMDACVPPMGYVEYVGDCNDMNASIRPGVTETCDGVDQNCDGTVDGPVAALQCPGNHPLATNVATWVCAAGACDIATCRAGFADCDGEVANGCEIGTDTTVTHCGGCNVYCAGGSTCVAGRCRRDITHLEAGASNSCIARPGGLWCWGNGESAQFADPGVGTQNQPLQITSGADGAGGPMGGGLLDVAQLGIGDRRWNGDMGMATHLCAVVRAAGGLELRCWGRNDSGQAGAAPSPTVDTASRVILPGSNFVEGSALGLGSNHTCAITTGGIRCWGANDRGQLGNGAALPGMNVDASATTPVTGGATGVIDLDAGSRFSCAVGTTGTPGVYCWGAGNRGQLGNGGLADSASPVRAGTLTGVIQISLGFEHACAVAGTTVYCWGAGTQGQLGTGMVDRSSPVAVAGSYTQVAAGESHTCAIESDGDVVCWGGGSPTLVTRTDVRDVVRLAAGSGHTCARTRSGEVHCWGPGAFGQLGFGATAPASTTALPVAGLFETWRSCNHRHTVDPAAPTGISALDVDGPGASPAFDAWCDMTSSGGGWTLVLKASGTSPTFDYTSGLWNNVFTWNAASLDAATTEAKLQAYLNVSFDRIRVVMRDVRMGADRAVELPVAGANIRTLFGGPATDTVLGAPAWRGLVETPSLQSGCVREGLNHASPFGFRFAQTGVRIGILTDDDADCMTPNAWIGVGGNIPEDLFGFGDCSESSPPTLSVGNYARADCGADGGTQYNDAFAWVWVR